MIDRLLEIYYKIN